MRVFRFLYIILAVGLAISCNDDKTENKPNVGPSGDIVVKLNPTIAQNDIVSEFADGDRLGLYVVNYSGDNPGGVAASGNQVDNVAFEYSSAEQWAGGVTSSATCGAHGHHPRSRRSA